eukprot:3271877-Pyramimonas_sp.AAC.1
MLKSEARYPSSASLSTALLKGSLASEKYSSRVDELTATLSHHIVAMSSKPRDASPGRSRRAYP